MASLLHRHPSLGRILVSCLLVSFAGWADLGRNAHWEEVSSPNSTRVAVMIVGGVRVDGIPIWQSIQTHVVAPLQQHYGGVDVFFCIGQSDSDNHLREYVILESPLEDNIPIFWSYELTTNENKTASEPLADEIPHPQFKRIEVCYDRITKGSIPQYDFIVKTRPDVWWFHSVPLPFSKNHVLSRARVVQGMRNLTHGQIAYPYCQSGHCRTNRHPRRAPPFDPHVHTICGLADDQVAVVPRLHHEAYFRGRGARLPLVSDTADDVPIPWPAMSIDQSCSCFKHNLGFSTEAKFTRRLASLNVTIALAPFHVRLTEKEGPGFRFWDTERDFNATVNCM